MLVKFVINFRCRPHRISNESIQVQRKSVSTECFSSCFLKRASDYTQTSSPGVREIRRKKKTLTTTPFLKLPIRTTHRNFSPDLGNLRCNTRDMQWKCIYKRIALFFSNRACSMCARALSLQSSGCGTYNKTHTQIAMQFYCNLQLKYNIGQSYRCISASNQHSQAQTNWFFTLSLQQAT